jgi:hypothetical protein
MDAVVIVSPILLLDVLVAFLLCTSDLCNKFLVYIPNVGASSSLDEPVLLSNRLIELPPVLLEFNDYWIRRKSFHNFLRNIFRSTRIAGKAHMSEGFGEPVRRRPIQKGGLYIKSNLLVEI